MLMPFVFGNHERMKELERRIGQIARSRLPLLIEGASGTGKQALSTLLHDISGVTGGMTRILCRKSGSVIFSKTSDIEGAADWNQVYRGTRGTLFLRNVHLLSILE